LLDAPGIPRVAIAATDRLPGLPKVNLDLDHFFQRAVSTLVAKGRQRIAILCASRTSQLVDKFHAALATHGVQSRRTWEQFAAMNDEAGARNVMELMFAPVQAERPDGLIIADDNLIAGATAGIAAAGIATPHDLDVVALSNFPNVLPAAVPVTRLGFDISAVLDLLTERLEQVIRDEVPPEHTSVPSVLESEL
jgi:DNA-binding LacI/PurR family transcriptional regulator